MLKLSSPTFVVVLKRRVNNDTRPELVCIEITPSSFEVSNNLGHRLRVNSAIMAHLANPTLPIKENMEDVILVTQALDSKASGGWRRRLTLTFLCALTSSSYTSQLLVARIFLQHRIISDSNLKDKPTRGNAGKPTPGNDSSSSQNAICSLAMEGRKQCTDFRPKQSSNGS
ncbi:hypothetical protein D5086_031265 [Populus alba]|uniref:Uncharacterized protein n=1 Tax=Populus alba TaxID=43335 RepID=A0ACC4AQU6_POPAL